MKSFFQTVKNNGEIIRKFLLNLITMSFFGLFITIPVSAFVEKHKYGPFFTIIASVFSFGFFLFIIHDAFWHIGAKNGIREKARGDKVDGWIGFKCTLVAYSPVILMTIAIIVLRIMNQITGNEIAAQVYGILVVIINFLFHGMYLGVFNIIFAQNAYSLVFFVLLTLILPSLSYYIGTKDIKLRTLLGFDVKDSE